jgi:hypothetical protein
MGQKAGYIRIADPLTVLRPCKKPRANAAAASGDTSPRVATAASASSFKELLTVAIF